MAPPAPPPPDSGNGDPVRIQVLAPCDMSEGYTFLARTPSCEEVAVTVPRGGVRQGEVFGVLRSTGTLISPSSILSFTNLPDAATGTSSETTPLVGAQQQMPPPPHPWKASLWDCCCCGRRRRRQGLCHAGSALCCPQLLAARVMVRLRLDWLAIPDRASGSSHKRRTFAIVTAMVCVFWAALVVTIVPHLVFLETEEVDEDVSDVVVEEEQNQVLPGTAQGRLCQGIFIVFGVYTLYILTKLRHFVRRKYQIATTKCCCASRSVTTSRRSSDSCAPEDCCVSLWCSCCVASQLLRQTAEEDDTTDCSRCCSPYSSIEGDENSTTTEISSRCDDSTSLAAAELA